MRRRADVSRHHHHHTQRARTPDAQAGSQAGLSAPHMHVCAPPRPPWVAGWRGELRGGDRRRELDCPATSRGDFLDIFHVSRVYQCNPHVPSRTASLAILVPIRSPFIEISRSQKSEHDFPRADCRDLTSLCPRLCIGVRLHIGFCPPNSSGKCTDALSETFISTAQGAMAGRDLDVTFAPRKLLSSATSSSSSGTQCRGGADPARHSLCGCRSTSLHMLHGSACCKTPSNAMWRSILWVRPLARQDRACSEHLEC